MNSTQPGDSYVAPSFFTRLIEALGRRYQKFLDDVTPYATVRWIVCIVSLVLYGIRTYMLQGWYIVTYALGIYLLNLLIAFLQPKVDPAIMEMENEGDSDVLPTKQSDEYKGFVRRLPEFKFWLWTQRAIIVAFLCTFFKALNVPVFWPILVLYFFVLFGISMKRQIQHMIKYKYVPFSVGKPKHKGKEDTGKVITPR
eukprot:m.43535 g.43535  ORF g.43535 m.43535 type:complete len:198 (+) comp12229_c0_seq2:227-820(+)